MRGRVESGCEAEKTLSGILAALYYLSKEAERSGLATVAGIIRDSICDINVAGGDAGRELERNRGLSSHATCSVLEFFDLYLRASPAARQQFLETLTGGLRAAS